MNLLYYTSFVTIFTFLYSCKSIYSLNIVMKKDGFITKKLSLLYTPKTANQKIYVNALNTK
jgi:hypothetical protein